MTKALKSLVKIDYLEAEYVRELGGHLYTDGAGGWYASKEDATAARIMMEIRDQEDSTDAAFVRTLAL